MFINNCKRDVNESGYLCFQSVVLYVMIWAYLVSTEVSFTAIQFHSIIDPLNIVGIKWHPDNVLNVMVRQMQGSKRKHSSELQSGEGIASRLR